MIRLLFVDDEAAVLEGLENRLARMRKRWAMTFAVGPEQALSCLERERFDVIVSDMRMPGMDGAELLAVVRERYGHMVRLILSGQTSKDAILRVLPIAHQVLSKPCEIEVLAAAVERACALRGLLDDSAVRQLAAKADGVPAAPALHQALTRALGSEHTGLAEVGAIIEQDPSMTARLLQIVNSAYFSFGRTLSRAGEAVAYLGFDAVRGLVLSIELFGRLERDAAFGVDVGALQHHSLLVARIATGLVEDESQRGVAFSAAVLHDVGKLILASAPFDYYRPVRSLSLSEDIPEEVAERRLHGHTHAEVGAYLLAIWGLPYPIVEAVAHHHQPMRAVERGFGAIAAVHVAGALADELSRGAEHRRSAGIDPGLIEKFGRERIAACREAALPIITEEVS
jgi:putative nucleotidyltransferase with HDIG domain